MQFFQNRLYLVTTDDALACIDASEAAKAGTVPLAEALPAPKPVAAAIPGEIETTVDVGDGVVVECIEVGNQVRLRVLSSGYERDGVVQFPKELRQERARHVVDEVRESARGGFYRAHGGMRRLVQN